MFGLDDHKDKDKDSDAGGLPFTPPPLKPEPKPDGVLDGTIPAPVTASATSSFIKDTSNDDTAGQSVSPTDKTPILSTGADSRDLIGIKQEALKHLSPLVGHLDQTPEEKFRTTMMMIQASDDESLIKTAFEAAKNIKDDKERAQALLDVINEINYFTQPHDK